MMPATAMPMPATVERSSLLPEFLRAAFGATLGTGFGAGFGAGSSPSLRALLLNFRGFRHGASNRVLPLAHNLVCFADAGFLARARRQTLRPVDPSAVFHDPFHHFIRALPYPAEFARSSV